MAGYRRGRVNEAVTNEVSQIMREVKDPRLDGLMLTVTGADVTPDLKQAKIYYSVMGEYEAKELSRALKSVSPFVRSQLARRLNMRNTPEITFVFDESVGRGAHINELIRAVSATTKGKDTKTGDAETDAPVQGDGAADRDVSGETDASAEDGGSDE